MLILFCGAILKIASVAQCVARLFVLGNRRSYTLIFAGKYVHRYNLALAYACRDMRAAYKSSKLSCSPGAKFSLRTTATLARLPPLRISTFPQLPTAAWCRSIGRPPVCVCSIRVPSVCIAKAQMSHCAAGPLSVHKRLAQRATTVGNRVLQRASARDIPYCTVPVAGQRSAPEPKGSGVLARTVPYCTALYVKWRTCSRSALPSERPHEAQTGESPKI
jgi:hypothetical protein